MAGKTRRRQQISKKKPENGQKSVHSNESNDLLRLLSKRKKAEKERETVHGFLVLATAGRQVRARVGGDEVMHVGLGQPTKQQKKRINFFLYFDFFSSLTNMKRK